MAIGNPYITRNVFSPQATAVRGGLKSTVPTRLTGSFQLPDGGMVPAEAEPIPARPADAIYAPDAPLAHEVQSGFEGKAGDKGGDLTGSQTAAMIGRGLAAMFSGPMALGAYALSGGKYSSVSGALTGLASNLAGKLGLTGKGSSEAEGGPAVSSLADISISDAAASWSFAADQGAGLLGDSGIAVGSNIGEGGVIGHAGGGNMGGAIGGSDAGGDVGFGEGGGWGWW